MKIIYERETINPNNEKYSVKTIGYHFLSHAFLKVALKEKLS